jgi:hypothetical protein
MAIGTGGTHLSLMLIVLLVAAITIGRRFTILRLGLVTGFTLDFLCIGMGAAKGEIGLRMVEGLFVNRRDMAFLAFALLFEPPVVALLLLDILASLFMAIQAERCLGRLVKALMTFGAGLLPLGMAFDHLARHEGGFDAVGPGGASEARPKSQSNECNVAKEDLHNRWSGSIHIGGDNMKDRTGSQNVDEWNMEHVPQGKESFVGAELSDTFALLQIY